MARYLSTLLALATAVLVNGHGQAENVTVDGQVYLAWNAYLDDKIQPPPLRYTRPISTQNYVLDFTSKDITCNAGGNLPAGGTIPVKAGQQMLLKWDFAYPHPGPIMTYLAKCPGDDCSTFKGDEGDVWVKVDELVFDINADPQWASDWMMHINNGNYIVTIPPTLAPGGYLFRHEILALHSAMQIGGAQFYPMCSELRVTGNGATELPAGVALPGAYDPNDEESIHVQYYDINSGKTNYTTPGGRVWSEAAPNVHFKAFSESRPLEGPF